MQLLFQLRFHLNRLFWRNSSLVQRLVMAAFAVILLGLVLGVWAFAYNSFRFLYYTEGGGIDLMLFALFIGLTLLFSLFVLSSIATFGTLAYYANDLPFFFSMPINPIAIAQEKIAETMVLSGWGVLLLGSPIIISFGVVAHASWWYYLIASGGLIMLCLLSAMLGSALSILGFAVFSKIPRILSRIFIIVLAALALKLISLAVLPDIALIEDTVTRGSEFHLQSITPALSHIFPSYSLSLIIGQSIGLSANLETLAVLLLQIAAVVIITVACVHYLYVRGWQQAQEFKSGPVSLVKSKLFDSQAWLLEKREMLQLWRELRTAPQLIFTSILVGFYCLLLPFAHRLTLAPQNWQWFILALLVGVAGYVLATVGLRFAFPSMSLEAKASWLLWSVPTSLGNILRAKWRVSLLFMGALSALLALFTYTSLPIDAASRLIIALHIVLLGIFTAVVQLGFGLIYANFNESDPGALSTTGPGLLVVTISLVVVAFDALMVRDDLEALSNGITWSAVLHLILLTVTTLVILTGLSKRAYAAAQKYTF